MLSEIRGYGYGQGSDIFLGGPRPTRVYILSRFKGGFVIESKSVSRKHVTISVAPPTEGDGSKIHARSVLTIQDLNSKRGTQLDNVSIRGESRELQGNLHEIRLGEVEYLFRVRWVPVIFSFSLSSKEEKHKDPLAAARARLEPLDIKAAMPYLVGKTTHVVATKRNTAKGLQALINGKYIVMDAFVDAVCKAATPREPDDPESVSPLEEDYDGAWPRELDYLPPHKNEPVQRPAECFAPNEKRANVFEGYTFVFCDQVQFDSLQPTITNGGGKALIYKLDRGKTTVHDVVQYIESISGKKGAVALDGGSSRSRVVLIRFRCDKDMEDWSIELGNDIARALDQRLIEQNEFLDAILLNDASGLRKPLPVEIVTVEEDALRKTSLQEQGPVSGHPGSSSTVMAKTTTEVPNPPISRLRTRRPITSQFKGFDDGFDPASLPQASTKLHDGLAGVQEEEANNELDTTIQHAEEPGARKRPHPSSDAEDEEAMMNELLPGAAAMKRRRLEEDQARREPGEGTVVIPPVSPSPSHAGVANQKGGAKNVKRKPIDVLEVARTRREAEDAAVRRDEESLKVSLEGDEIAGLRNLVLIEEMPVKEKAPAGRRPGPDNDNDNDAGAKERWDERWNGRKNFKRFRRPGPDGSRSSLARRSAGTVFVGLEEAKKHGIGDTLKSWEHHNERPRTIASTERGTRAATERRSPPAPPSIAAAAAAAAVATTSRSQRVFDVDDDDGLSDGEGDARMTGMTPTASAAVTARTASTTATASAAAAHSAVDTPRSTTTASQRAPGGGRGRGRGGRGGGAKKRAAPKADIGPASKKARTTSLFARQSDEEEDDEEELKFRFS
ncbi:MAG: hypothetical protein M1826_001561 [Phylliscum demangeonii]|nr:MAG: hypothetical protein M1826_001561 [Phylliscum demangeonii]